MPEQTEETAATCYMWGQRVAISPKNALDARSKFVQTLPEAERLLPVAAVRDGLMDILK